MKRLIIVGSPRANGRSAHLAEMLFEASIDERPEDELFLVPVSEVEIGPCIGCNACRRASEITFKNDAGDEVTELRQRCVFDDDMQALYDLLEEADELIIVSPVYFSGAPAPMKCVFDRMQPYFWVTQEIGRSLARADVEGAGDSEAGLPDSYVRRLLTKRPATLHVIGEGGDPHGFDPLISEATSSLACAGFQLERVLDWVGKISATGEIVSEATEVVLSAPAREREAKSEGPQLERQKPKLDLSSGSARGTRGQQDSRNARSSQPSKRQGRKGSGKGKAKPKGQGGHRG